MKALAAISVLLAVTGHVYGQAEEHRRARMVRQQLEARGISHKATLDAMQHVERHLFVPAKYRQQAYDDTPLPIGHGQTISQPYIVAYMTQLLGLKATDRVLEIGTGSGYQAAVLAEIVKEVFTIEIVKPLGQNAQKVLSKLGYDNVTVVIGDGYRGLDTQAPFDAIMVTAAAEDVPPPLISQLKDGGKLVMPVGAPGDVQTLMLVEKRKGKPIKTELMPVRFVPFTRDQ
ncbi:protein-L-isoaspartate(D-aspartate) O-methyltransferase [Parapedobacter composti]|uniref:Protein-L-isoaspartate O-methyltransferase n=1 Tax=Parapedobacter composti TaxID=623281 RepID=A0A1I1FKA1_9SPHI|nr:protein-L-isoaspartate(D-aspartate) O-methyltransferase [Parapedobacter composti]SFB99721.1 protein-L-isoaspartate(D-aspartate) O-methyltransferase [Parapedobacter composti]